MSLAWSALVLTVCWTRCSHLAHAARENETVTGEVPPSTLLVTFFMEQSFLSVPMVGLKTPG